MSFEMKLGRWRAKDNSVHEIRAHDPERYYPWIGPGDWIAWRDDGQYAAIPSDLDLIEYLGPLSTTPACADEAVTSPVPTVSTGMGGETLPPQVAKELSALHKENNELKRKLKEQPSK